MESALHILLSEAICFRVEGLPWWLRRESH
jgi:hypothetical protein